MIEAAIVRQAGRASHSNAKMSAASLVDGHSAHLGALDSLRALAALHVFLVHYVALFAFLLAEGSLAARGMRGAFAHSSHGAYLFFVLSGFLIYRSVMLRRQSLRGYLARRVRRIYPTFAAVFSLYLALSIIFPGRSKLPAAEMWQYLLANAALLPGLVPIRPVVTVAWTLSYELCFYLGIGIVVMSLGMRAWSPSSRALFFLGFVALYAAVGDVFGLRLGPMLMFVPGILLFDLLDKRRIAREPVPMLNIKPLIPAAVAAILGVLALFGFGGPARGLDATAAVLRSHIGIALLFGIIVWMSIGGSARFSRFCMWPPLRWLGGISYSFYLIHGLVLGTIAMALKSFPTLDAMPFLFWIGLPISLGAAIAAAWVLFVAVEQRFSTAIRAASGSASIVFQTPLAMGASLARQPAPKPHDAAPQ